MDRANLEPAVLGGKPVFKIKGAKINSKGNISVFVPVEKIKEDTLESLRESVEKDLAAINKEAEHEVLQSKLDKIDVLIDKRKSQLGKLDEDEDMKALTDKKKVKELEKDIKKLEQAKAKVEKMIGKTKGKKKEIIDEVGEEEMPEAPSHEETDAAQVYEEGFLGNIFSKKDEELESMMQEADELAAETGKPHYVMAGSYGKYVTDNPSGKSGKQIYSTEEFK